MRVSGQRPEQGAAAKFFAQQKTWAQGPYPAQCSLCYSHAASELIRLSARQSLDFGLPVESRVAGQAAVIGSPVSTTVAHVVEPVALTVTSLLAGSVTV